MPTPTDSILNNPQYLHLVKTRRRLSLILSLVMLVSYLSFILLIAFKPAVLGTPIAAGSPITLGIPMGLGLILLAFAITGIYVRLSNTLFDPLTEAARKAVGGKKE